jgi:pantetheine-phosphate adenylyltransferase
MHIFVAGTFDRFHDGHKYLLNEAIKRGEKVTIGVTSDLFVKTYKHIPNAESFPVRKQRIEEWGNGKNISIISIDDPYEPAASANYDALIVTKDNRKTGEEINQKRKAKKLHKLTLIEIPLLPAHDGAAISSTRIRSGEIDIFGNRYLPDGLRSALRKPLGLIVLPENLKKNFPGKVITVGDVTTDCFLGHGMLPDLAIIDLHARRKPYKLLHEFSFPQDMKIARVASGPGYISHEAFMAIEDWSRQGEKMILLITGEDDLLVLPAIDVAPCGTVLYYGQPDAGIVEVVVNGFVKEHVRKLLDRFVVQKA